MIAEQPRLPLAYYEQRVPVPARWDEIPCGYLLFGPPYDEVAADALTAGGWSRNCPVRTCIRLVGPARAPTCWSAWLSG